MSFKEKPKVILHLMLGSFTNMVAFGNKSSKVARIDELLEEHILNR